jgi:hypothetical protein
MDYSLFICIAAVGVIFFCGRENGEPEPGFELKGVWIEKSGDSKLEITEEGGFVFNFNPPLSDGNTMLKGESFERVDRARMNFLLILGLAPIQVVKVEARINSKHEMRFEFDGKKYCFQKEGE